MENDSSQDRKSFGGGSKTGDKQTKRDIEENVAVGMRNNKTRQEELRKGDSNIKGEPITKKTHMRNSLERLIPWIRCSKYSRSGLFNGLRPRWSILSVLSPTDPPALFPDKMVSISSDEFKPLRIRKNMNVSYRSLRNVAVKASVGTNGNVAAEASVGTNEKLHERREGFKGYVKKRALRYLATKKIACGERLSANDISYKIYVLEGRPSRQIRDGDRCRMVMGGRCGMVGGR